MNKPAFNRSTSLLFSFLLAGVNMWVLQAKPDIKLTPAEVVAKHLESIGSAEARGRVHSARIKGTCELTSKLGGTGQSAGQVLMASQGSQNLIQMTFDSGEPATGLAFDGSKTAVTQFRPGRHTPLEQFFAEYEAIVKEGLLGGTLAQSWPLLNLQEKNPKLEYAGKKKIDGKELHAIKYTPRKGSELKITLFFDMETFRHVRTEYEQTIYSTQQKRIGGGGGGLPSIDNERGAAQRLNAYEEFSDFKPEGGLNLPHTYKFELSVQSQTRPILIDWTFNLNAFTFNEPFNASEFTVSNVTSKPD
jgi:hypothetical protein